jgi:hypothetical protein
MNAMPILFERKDPLQRICQFDLSAIKSATKPM